MCYSKIGISYNLESAWLSWDLLILGIFLVEKVGLPILAPCHPYLCQKDIK